MIEVDDSTLAFTALQPDDILDTLDELGFECNGRFLALNSYENRVYKIGVADNDNVVVKFYRPGRWSDDAILEEHAFAMELVQQEIPVVPPLEIDNETLFHSGLFRLAVYACRGGRAARRCGRCVRWRIAHLCADHRRHGQVLGIESLRSAEPRR